MSKTYQMREFDNMSFYLIQPGYLEIYYIKLQYKLEIFNFNSINELSHRCNLKIQELACKPTSQ